MRKGLTGDEILSMSMKEFGNPPIFNRADK